MREYVDGIYIKLKPNERELIKSRMKEAGILVEYHELGEEQQKRVLLYLKTLKKLEDLENI